MSDGSNGALMTIGSVARATGIPANTIRTWERRYGFPRPERTETGQRVYRTDVVRHLQLVSEALEAGHRPRQVLSMALNDLRALLTAAEPSSVVPEGMVPESWKTAVKALSGESLEASMRQDCARMGALRFIDDRVGPFLTWVGDEWHRGRLELHQEHFASDTVRLVLDQTWRSLAPAVPASVVCATLPGELHDLGVHLAAVAVASGGRRPLVLPGETPVADIVAAAAATASVVVAISLSVHAGNRDYLPMLNELRARLPDDTQLWVGGGGAPREVAGAVVSDDLARLADLV